MDIFFIISVMVLLILAEGFFSGSEIALVHADRLKLYHQSHQGKPGATLVLKMLRRPERLLGTTLVGTNLSVVALTTLGTLLMIRLFGEYGDLLAFLIFMPIFLIFGEVVPKSVYQQRAEYLAPKIIYPLRFFSWLFYPVVFAFSWIARMVARMAGVTMAQRELFVNREQIRSVVEMAERGANVDVFDRERILKVVRYADVTVGDVMTPITEMTTIGVHCSTRDAVRLVQERSHFRLPAYEGEHNQIVGVVSLTMWDLMDPDLVNRPLADLLQPAHYVPVNEPLDELLPVLQQRKDHMAVVVDEFGSALGMITLEEILEEVVGDVVNVGYTFEGYVPREKYSIENVAEGEFLMDGRVPVTDAAEALSADLSTMEAHTVGGMVIAHLRHIPKQGESLEEAGYRFTVEKVNERGIQRLRATVIE